LTHGHPIKIFISLKKLKKKKREKNLICNKNSQSQGASALDFSQQEED
jgi:hypothetical protein